jgi:phage shock protein PspC (stress-responsive transcriptional regulator)
MAEKIRNKKNKSKSKKKVSKNQKILYRSKKNRVIGGVCGGLAEYLEADPTIIRILWVLGSLLWGFAIFVYLIFWILIPEHP